MEAEGSAALVERRVDLVEGGVDDATLALTTPLMRKHLNPFGRYHFDLDRMRQTLG